MKTLALIGLPALLTAAAFAVEIGAARTPDADPPAIADVPPPIDLPVDSAADAEVPLEPRAPGLVPAPAPAEGPAIAELPESLIVRDGPTLILVVGAAGTPEYGRQFAEWAERWERAAAQANARTIRIGETQSSVLRRTDDAESGKLAPDVGAVTHRDRLRDALAAQTSDAAYALWLVFLGHGTFDGRTPRFNLDGPDLTDADLAAWLEPFDRPIAIVQCASCSGAFLPKLAAPGRVVITATKSGSEHNACRFGDHLSKSLVDAEADLDHDGQTSILEAWLLACRRTDESYFAEGRIPTEHALLDDNGDGRGVRPDAFRGVRPRQPLVGGSNVAAPAATLADGHRAHLLALTPGGDGPELPPHLRYRRDELELQVAALRDRRTEFPPDEYDRKLETLFVELAKLSESASPLRTAGQGVESRE